MRVYENRADLILSMCQSLLCFKHSKQPRQFSFMFCTCNAFKFFFLSNSGLYAKAEELVFDMTLKMTKKGFDISIILSNTCFRSTAVSYQTSTAYEIRKDLNE